ncbi:P-loop containing nucleoside triphosphate hydrolase protein [Powellomyces hirtus]|nr:P-loop containing nucleoside triphosphate hydrolase protein [Powellomyces hirtus]
MLHRPADSLPGLEKAYQGLMDILTYPLLYPEMVEKLGIEPPKGVLLHGPPGVGKTYLVSTVARACGASMLTINGPEIFGAYQGESEERLREKFQEAQAMATGRSPCILFIDEMDALTPRRESARSHENRVVAQLLTLMDGMSSRGSLIVVGSTNQPNAIDAALRRPGRFDREVAIDVPSEAARLAILTSLCKSIPLGADVDLTSVAAATNGYVGADLAALSREAAMEAVRRTQTDSDLRQVNNDCFLKALAHLGGPSTQRGATVSVEKLTWDDVGGLEAVKQRLRQAVEWPLMYKDTYKKLGLKPPRGVLLYGPPGCSKTTLVKIIAATSGATFLSLNGAALYSPFVGDSEQAIRNTFQRARSGAPSVVFFDEVDAIVGKRGLDGGGGGKGGDTVQERVLSTLLNEMDGVELAKDVLVVGATNRPDMIDAALMRPGRFDKIIYVPPPDATARHQILQIYTKSMSLAPEVDIQQIAEVRTVRYTGADLKAVCREAAMEALRSGRDAAMVEVRHMEAALAAVKPTLSDEMLAQYQAFAQQFGSGVDAMA